MSQTIAVEAGGVWAGATGEMAGRRGEGEEEPTGSDSAPDRQDSQ